ncbi:MAG: phosphoribosylglycinamide formyltransferase [Thermoplasmata archaeon]
MVRTLPIAVLVSGEGTTLEGLAELAVGGHLPVRIVLVVADRPHAHAIERARLRGIPTIVLPSRGVDPDVWSDRLTKELVEQGVELVVLAGFLSILPPRWVDRWEGRAINLHPALLPRHGGPGMYGTKVHRAVLDAGDTETGATVHLVTSEVDGGPTIAQERLPVLPDDTTESLRARLHPVEVALLAATLRRFAEGLLPLPYPGPGERDAGRHERSDARE